MFKPLMAGILAAALAAPAFAQDIASSVDPAALDDDQKTPQGLYLTAEDAHAALEADPGIVFVDVRGPHEVNFVGLPDAADQNIPFVLKTHEYDPEEQRYTWMRNPDFVAEVDALMAREGRTKADPVFVMCRSGGRSAMAAAALDKAGYERVYSVVDGFEGGKDAETGHRTVEGWRNAGLPWHYGIRPEQVWQPKP